MARARIADDLGVAAVVAALGAGASRDATATGVRYLLQLLSEQATGNTVEVRVPPFGAVQAIEGPRHTRATRAAHPLMSSRWMRPHGLRSRRAPRPGRLRWRPAGSPHPD